MGKGLPLGSQPLCPGLMALRFTVLDATPPGKGPYPTSPLPLGKELNHYKMRGCPLWMDQHNVISGVGLATRDPLFEEREAPRGDRLDRATSPGSGTAGRG